MAYVKITRQTFLSGQPALVGETYEVDDDTARQVVEFKKGEIVDPPADAIIEATKPKVKKVETK